MPGGALLLTAVPVLVDVRPVASVCLATEELLVEAQEKGETSIGCVGFLVGLLIDLVPSEPIG